MKPVSTATFSWVIERDLEIVLADKPSESTPGFIKPVLFISQAISLKTRGDSRASLDGLLIKADFLARLRIESPGTDWHKDTFIIPMLFRAIL